MLELGPIRPPSAILLLVVLALGVVPASIGLAGCAMIAAQPDRVTLCCARQGELVTCDELKWWQQDDGWRFEMAARHRGDRSTLRHYRSGKSAKSCVAFDATSACGGDARANAEKLRSLANGASVELDATRSETLALVMAFGSLSGLLFMFWSMFVGVLVGRRTRARVRILPHEIWIERLWAGVLPVRGRRVARSAGETATVSLRSRGGRGSLPTWQLSYEAGTTSQPLLTVAALQLPPELEQAAERVRRALID